MVHNIYGITQISSGKQRKVYRSFPEKAGQACAGAGGRLAECMKRKTRNRDTVCGRKNRGRSRIQAERARRRYAKWKQGRVNGRHSIILTVR